MASSAVVAIGFGLPFLLGEAAWAFGLLVAPMLLVAVAALPFAAWSSCSAIVTFARGEDSRRWVLALAMAVLLATAAIGVAVLLRYRTICC